MHLPSVFVPVDSYMQEALETLQLFERDCMSTFVDLEEKAEEESMDQRIKLLEEK